MDKKYFDLDTIRDTILNSEHIEWNYGDVDPESILCALEYFTDPADVRENKRGKWEIIDGHRGRCSHCKFVVNPWVATFYNFCPQLWRTNEVDK